VKIDFGGAIKRVWQVTWHHKTLWMLGMFAGVSGGHCQNGNSNPGLILSLLSPVFIAMFFSQGQGDSPEALPTFIAVSGFMLLGLAWWVLSIAAQGGIISGVDQIEAGENPRMGALLKAGFSKFLSLWGLNLLVGLPVFLVGAIAFGAFAAIMTALGDLVPAAAEVATMFGSICIAILVLPVFFVGEFFFGSIRIIGQRYIVLGGRGAFQALDDAWRFLRVGFKNVLLMYLINYGFSLAVYFVFYVLMYVIALPLLLGSTLLAPTALNTATTGTPDDPGLFLVAFGLSVYFLLYTIVLQLYTMIVGTPTSTLWTLFFRQMTGMGTAEQVVSAPQPVELPAEPMPVEQPPAEPSAHEGPPAPPSASPPPHE